MRSFDSQGFRPDHAPSTSCALLALGVIRTLIFLPPHFEHRDFSTRSTLIAPVRPKALRKRLQIDPLDMHTHPAFAPDPLGSGGHWSSPRQASRSFATSSRALVSPCSLGEMPRVRCGYSYRPTRHWADASRKRRHFRDYGPAAICRRSNWYELEPMDFPR